MKRRVLRPQALGIGILVIVVSLSFLGSSTWESAWRIALGIGGGVILVLLSGYIIRIPW